MTSASNIAKCQMKNNKMSKENSLYIVLHNMSARPKILTCDVRQASSFTRKKYLFSTNLYVLVYPYALHVDGWLHCWGIWLFNSLAPGRCGCYLKSVIFKLVSQINILSISCEIVLKWMPPDLTDDKSTLIQVMAWCRQATSHYLNQCWPRPMPYGITRPQRANGLETAQTCTKP